MKHAIILYGPSGAGKTTLSNKICKKYDYKHCDTDVFKQLFSTKRSEERSKISSKISYLYAKELIKENYNVIIEALPLEFINKLRPLLKKHNYKIIEISLAASLEKCIKNDQGRTDRKFGKAVIEEVYPWYNHRIGHIIDTEKKTPDKVFKEVEAKYF